MSASASVNDLIYKSRFESGAIEVSNFDHRNHLRLAYVYLCENETMAAYDAMRQSLRKFLKDNAVPESKYHMTLTYSWVQAVKHFMVQAGATASFDEFIEADDRLLDRDIMLTHYRPETLFSNQARTNIIQPDRQPIPQY